jgi:hypothetical protein
MTMTTPTPSAAQRIYYPRDHTSAIIWTIIILALLGCVLFDLIVWGGQTTNWWLEVVLLLVLLNALVGRALILSKKLIIHPDALRYHHLGFQLATPWSNLDRLCLMNRGEHSFLVIRLYQEEPIKRYWFARVPEGTLTVIPLINYDCHPGTPLLEDLERHAPQLFRPSSADDQGS